MEPMAKKRKRKTKKNAGGGVIVLLCIVGVALMLTIGNGGDFAENFQAIWEGTLDGVSGIRTDRNVQSLANLEHNGGKLIIYAISTGNSDSILVRAPEGNAMLVDAADADDFRQIASTIHSLDIEQLDVTVATHPDADHIGSMGKIIREFQPTYLYMPDYAKDTGVYQDMLAAVDQTGTQRVIAAVPMEFMLGSVRVQVIHPEQHTYSDPNDSSIVLLLTYGENKVLLTGDIETESLSEILDVYTPTLDIDVLKIAHHGSARSTTQELLDATTPEAAIITAGKNNDYGHPHTETIDLLDENDVTILRTDEQGDVAAFSDGTSWEYATAA